MVQLNPQPDRTKQLNVLVVEDNAADRFWLEYALQNLGLDCNIAVAVDGQQAVDFLLKRGEYSQAPTPDVIFLDVHLPKLDGLEVLREVPNAKELPICVLTSSESERAVFLKEFGIPDSNYLLKPVSHAGIAGSTCYRTIINPN